MTPPSTAAAGSLAQAARLVWLAGLTVLAGGAIALGSIVHWLSTLSDFGAIWWFRLAGPIPAIMLLLLTGLFPTALGVLLLRWGAALRRGSAAHIRRASWLTILLAAVSLLCVVAMAIDGLSGIAWTWREYWLFPNLAALLALCAAAFVNLRRHRAPSPRSY